MDKYRHHFRSSIGRCTIPTSMADVNSCTKWKSPKNADGNTRGPLINMHQDFGYFGGVKGVCCRDWSDIAATPTAVYGVLKPVLQIACPLGLEDLIPDDQFKFTVKGKLKKIPLREMICPSDWSKGPMDIPKNPADVPDLDQGGDVTPAPELGVSPGCQILPSGGTCDANAYVSYTGKANTICCDSEQSVSEARAANSSVFDAACMDYDFWVKQTQTNGSWEALRAEMCIVPSCYDGWSASNAKSLLPSGLGGALTVVGSIVTVAPGTGTPFSLVQVPGALDPRYMLVAANGFIGEMSDASGMQFITGPPDERALMVYLECVGGAVLLRTPTGGVLTASTYTVTGGALGASLYVDYGPVDMPDINDVDGIQDDVQTNDNIPGDADNISLTYAFILAGGNACNPACLNGATCVNNACSCTAGWGGADCGSCTKQCFNGGACSNTTGACVCAGMYAGDDCSAAVPFTLQLVKADGSGYNTVGVELRAGALSINMHPEGSPCKFALEHVGDGGQYYLRVYQNAFDGSHYPPTFNFGQDSPIYVRTGPPNYDGEQPGYVYVTANKGDANKFTVNMVGADTFTLSYTVPIDSFIVGDNTGFNMNSRPSKNYQPSQKVSNIWRAVQS